MDGEDTPPKSGLQFLTNLADKIKKYENVQIASVTGRFYAMDRGGHWPLTQKTLDAVLRGQGETMADPLRAISDRYQMNITDEMIPPTVITGAGNHAQALVKPEDGAIFFNFRNDRMIQLVEKFLEQAPAVKVLTMTSYKPDFDVLVGFSPMLVQDGLSEIISKKGWTQFHAAESEKFAHVTFFFNGHRHEAWPGEERKIVSSPALVKNYADTPQMSARELTDLVTERIKEKDDKFVLVNYANGDLLGHTGNIAAARQAVLVLDESLKSLAEAAEAAGALLVITADHGNCEEMIDIKTGEPNTEHTANPIPLIFYGRELRRPQRSGLNLYTLSGIVPEGMLPDVAPTILNALGVEVPMSMTGKAIDF